MDIGYNKPFLENIIKTFDGYFIPVHRKAEASVKVYNDAMTSVLETATSSTNAKFAHFVSESTLVILNKIDAAYDNLTPANKNIMKILVNTLLNGNLFQRNSALDKLVQMNIILATETAGTKALMATLLDYNVDVPFRNFISESEVGSSDINFYRYQYSMPIQLERKYLETNNPLNESNKREKLYLLFVARGQDTFGFSPATISGANEKFGYFIKNYKDNGDGTGVYKTGLSYIAVDIGDITSADATIKYDHVDKIEYLDNIIIQLFVPNKFND